jgi:dUTP pyrophosphatase
MSDSKYFQTIDSQLKAYLLGVIIFNIKKQDAKELTVQIDNLLPSVFESELKQFASDFDRESFVLKSEEITYIYKQLGLTEVSNMYNIEISHFIKSNNRLYVIEFLKAYFEKHGTIENNVCRITDYSKDNLDSFAEFFGIPNDSTNIFNLKQISYSNVNVIDLLGQIYQRSAIRMKNDLYVQFLRILNNERPILKFAKITDNAVTPMKANFSDAGFDVSIIGLCKQLNNHTSLYNTGIRLDIPVGYYVEMLPRSSISKSGYMLANSIGIIDCSYKGELLVALTKIDDLANIEYPYRCCQLIMRKQIFPEMVEISEVDTNTNRAEGGFGSSN